MVSGSWLLKLSYQQSVSLGPLGFGSVSYQLYFCTELQSVVRLNVVIPKVDVLVGCCLCHQTDPVQLLVLAVHHSQHNRARDFNRLRRKLMRYLYFTLL